MVVWLADGTKAVITDVVTEGLEEPVAVYNFEVKDFHTYFVGDSGVLVHNKCVIVEQDNPTGTGQAHHPISNKIESAAKQTDNLGDVSRRQTGTIIANTPEDHRGYQTWHREEDAQVVEWLNNNPAASTGEFVDYMNQVYATPDMIARFGNVHFREG